MFLSSDTPGKVENVTCERNSPSSVLTIKWNSLPSLDINDTDPDIVYSVELYQITCGQDIFMNNNNNMPQNSTSNSIDPTQIYGVTITARNNMEGARNGPSVEMKGILYIHTCPYL